MDNSILLTGGSGLLGQELQKYIDCYAPPHALLDLTKPIDYKKEDPELIIHCAGYTDVLKAESEKHKCFDVNFFGTVNLIDRFPDIPFVYISTEYAYHPYNFYAISKLETERYIRTKCKTFLIIRTLFKARPFPCNMAFADQWTKGDYVDVIAPMIISAIFRWNKETNRIIDVGTERKTIFELAKRSRPLVAPGSVDDIVGVKLPKDYR